MRKSKSGGHKANNNNQGTWLETIARTLSDIAQSLRDQTQLQKEARDREQAKGRRPSIIKISQAKYPGQGQGDEPTGESVPGAEAGAEVPGFRRR